MELRGEGVQLFLEHSDDDDPGVLVQVSNEDEGQASLVLMREDVQQVHDFLAQWLADED